MDWIFGSKTAVLEDLVQFFELDGNVEKAVRAYPWPRVKKGEARRILAFLRANENKEIAANLLRYAILAPDNDRTKITFLFTAIKYPRIPVEEKNTYFDLLEEALTRIQAEAVNVPDNVDELLKIRVSLGKYFALRGDFEYENGSKVRAVDAFYNQALAIFKLLNDQPMIDYLSGKIGQAETHLGQLEKDTLPNLEKMIADLMAERAKLFAEINARDQELLQLNASIEQRQAVLEDVQSQVQQNQQHLEALRASQQQELDEFENQKTGIDKSVRILKKRFSEYRKKTEQEGQKCAALQLEVRDLEAQKDEILSLIQVSQLQPADAPVLTVDDLEKTSQLETTIQSLNAQMESLETRKRALLDEVESLQGDVERLRADRTELDRDLAQLTTKKTAGQKKVRQQEQALQNIEEQLARKREEFQKTDEDLNGVTERIQGYEKTIDALRSQNLTLQSQLDEARKEPASPPKNGNRNQKINTTDPGLPDWLN